MFLYYLPSVNFWLEMFFFSKKGIPARTLFITCIAIKFVMLNTSFLATVVTLLSAGVAMLARLTIADHSCSNKHSMERVGKVKNADKGKKCNTTCVLIPKNITKGLIIVWHAGYSSWSIHYFKADTLHSQTIHLYQTALVKSCSLVKIKIPYPASFPSRSSHPDPLKTQNPAPALYWNSRFPLLFSAHIPNIAPRISQIPHPAKPIVNPQHRATKKPLLAGYLSTWCFSWQNVFGPPQKPWLWTKKKPQKH